MYSTARLLRIAKTVSVFAIGVMAFFIVLGNTTDYYTNYYFVEHVLRMDTTFPNSTIRYRSLNDPIFFHGGYVLIILLETLMAACCLRGSWQMATQLTSDAATFHAAKNWGVAGLIIGVVIWFLGFEVIGGEWFAMWQSSTWNGLNSAERIVNVLFLVLLFLHLKDE